MSLEQAIADNTAAIRELIAVMGARGVVTAEAPAPILVRAADPEAARPAKADAPAAEVEQPITRDSAKEIAKALNVKDAKKLKEVLTTLGAPNFAAVKDEQLDEFVKLAKAAL